MLSKKFSFVFGGGTGKYKLCLIENVYVLSY